MCHDPTGCLLHTDHRYASDLICTRMLVASSATGIRPNMTMMSAIRQQATRILAKPSREAVKHAPGVIAG